MPNDASDLKDGQKKILVCLKTGDAMSLEELEHEQLATFGTIERRNPFLVKDLVSRSLVEICRLPPNNEERLGLKLSPTGAALQERARLSLNAGV